MGYWKSKVLPKIKKVFEKNSVKKAGAAEACKAFDDSKEQYTKEFEDKKTELHPKVIEIYEASSVEIKALIKEPNDAGLKKYSSGVDKFLDELSKIEFPGSKPAHEASAKYGPTLVPGPIFFLLEKVTTFIITDEKKEEEVPQAETVPAAPPAEEESSGKEETEKEKEKEKEIVVEEEKKEEVAVKAEKTEAEQPKAEEVASSEPPKP